MNIFSVILSTVSISGLVCFIVHNVCLIIKTYKDKKNKSSQDNKGGDI